MSNELYKAIFDGNLEAVKKAVEIEKIDVNQLDPAIGLPPLAIAVREGQFDIFCYLIAQKANPNNVGSKNVPPINFIAAIDDNELKKRFITEFLKIPELKISVPKKKSLEVIAGTLNLEKLDLADKKDLTNLGGYLFYFNADGTTFINTYEDELDLNAVNEEKLSFLLAVLNYKVEGYKRDLDRYYVFKNLSTDRWLRSYSSSSIDLNASYVDDQHESKGISLAWIFAREGKYRALKALSKNSMFSIDLNVKPLNDKNRCKGMTLFWKLALDEEFDFLKNLLKNQSLPIDLNASPSHKKCRLRGVTVAWILAAEGQFDLLNDLRKNFPPLIKLDVSPLDDNQFFEEVEDDQEEFEDNHYDQFERDTLADLLISGKQFALFFEILEKYLSSDSQDDIRDSIHLLVQHEKNINADKKTIQSFLSKASHDYLVNLFNSLKNSEFKYHVQIALVNSFSQDIRKFLMAAKEKLGQDKESLEEAIHSLFTLIKDIPSESNFYKEARGILANCLLNQIVQYPENKKLQEFVLEKLKNLFPEANVNPLNQPIEIGSLIKLYAINFFLDAGDKRLSFALIAELMPKQNTEPTNVAPTTSFWGKRPLEDEEEREVKKLKFG
jgi:hypothetical protein